MRLFTAVELNEEVRGAAAALLDELHRRVSRAAPRARLTWADPERMHLTVRFIGEVSDEQAARIIGALRTPLDVAYFTLGWHGVGAFPKKGPPRVLWAGIGEGRAELIRAEAEISARLAAIGIPLEDRPYSPHLTLARVRDAGGLRPAVLFEGLAPQLGETWVRTITLFQSHVSPTGATHVAMQQTPLRSGQA